MSWHEVCQFLDQSDPTGGLGTHKREKMPLDDLLLEGSSCKYTRGDHRHHASIAILRNVRDKVTQSTGVSSAFDVPILTSP